MLLDVRLGSLVSVAFQVIKIMQLLLSQCLVRDFEDAVPLISEVLLSHGQQGMKCCGTSCHQQIVYMQRRTHFCKAQDMFLCEPAKNRLDYITTKPP